MAFQNIKTEKSSCSKYSIVGLLTLRHVISKTIKGLHKKNTQKHHESKSGIENPDCHKEGN
jgi:hypothetical protein